MLKILIDYRLLTSLSIFVGIVPNLMVLGSASSVNNFMKLINKKVVCVSAYFVWCGAKKKKNKNKIQRFSGTYISETTGAILSNLVCKVVYMVRLKYINLIEIDPIVLELQ